MGSDLCEISVTRLKGVGTSLASKLARLGIESVQDLLFHLPFRYEDRTRVTPIGAARPGQAYVLEGEITACNLAYGRRRSLLATLEDGTGRIGLRFYHFSKAMEHNLRRAGSIRCYGEVRAGATGPEIYHPEYASLKQAATMEASLTPVYPATEGISQSRYRSLVEQALALLDTGGLVELDLGDSPYTRMPIAEALRYLHRPPPDADTQALLASQHPAQRRLAFEELLAHQASLRLVREEMKKLHAPPLKPPGSRYTELGASLGFSLTKAQEKVASEVAKDMMTASPTLRLVQGDVGSGKTVIAALAAIHAFENGLQTALMAPTELLAEQHFINLSSWLLPLGIRTARLTSRVTGKKREETLAQIGTGNAELVIGTHALFQPEVAFQSLGLIIIDEQHRFGVHQRLALREKGVAGSDCPHQLVMTATPIPRTLSMSIYADMDVSVIDELPPGRRPVTTSVLPDERRDQVVARVAHACAAGAQVYWVCTLIDESEALECQAAEATAEELSKLLPEVKVGLIHGRMNATDKAQAMSDFKHAKLDLLVATTVIEVGVDVPNATLMVIENSERLGLAQLHQLRGRIGRGAKESHCLLLYKKPLGELSRERLAVMRQSNDGFFIAERDLEIRGPGEILGSKQSGSLEFKIANLMRDQDMLPEVRQVAAKLLQAGAGQAEQLVSRWIKESEKLFSG